MTYKTLDDLALIFEKELTEEEKVYFSGLIKTYFDALHNPPEGVIGVGAISYAEQKLLEAQI